jgi:prevent-host-death family protein
VSSYSVAEAKDELSTLIDRALKGEDVVITRDGAPVIELRPIAEVRPAVGRPMSEADLEWLAAGRALIRGNPNFDSGAFISAMRDEDEH